MGNEVVFHGPIERGKTYFFSWNIPQKPPCAVAQETRLQLENQFAKVGAKVILLPYGVKPCDYEPP